MRDAMRIARLLGLGLLASISGCAVTRTDHQIVRGTPSAQDIPLGPPLLSKSQLVGGAIDVQVAPGQCVLETTTPVVEKDRISRHPSVPSTLTFLGFGAGLGGLGYLAWNRADDRPEKCPESMTGDSCTTKGEQQVLAGLLWAGGAALAGYGVYDLIRGERDVHEKETASRKEVQRSAPRACSATLANHAIEIRLPDGQLLKGLTDRAGAGHFEVPESCLQAASASLRAAVLIDGRASEPVDLSSLVSAYRRAHPVRLVLGAQDSRYLFLADGQFVATAPPAVSGAANSPRIAGVRATETLINGGAAFVDLETEDPDGEGDIDRVVIVTEGDSGYYVLPTVPSSGGRRRVRLGIRDSVTESRLRVGFALMDRAGHVSDYEFRSFPIVRTGTGDLKVSLTFDRGTDLDLRVIEPSKETIFYGNRGSRSGGQLDLDSNAACRVDGVNNENVFWQTGTAPSGEYEIYVHHFRNCVSEPTSYSVTVYNGRKVETFEGTLGKDERTPRLVTKFTRAREP